MVTLNIIPNTEAVFRSRIRRVVGDGVPLDGAFGKAGSSSTSGVEVKEYKKVLQFCPFFVTSCVCAAAPNN